MICTHYSYYTLIIYSRKEKNYDPRGNCRRKRRKCLFVYIGYMSKYRMECLLSQNAIGDVKPMHTHVHMHTQTNTQYKCLYKQTDLYNMPVLTIVTDTHLYNIFVAERKKIYRYFDMWKVTGGRWATKTYLV